MKIGRIDVAIVLGSGLSDLLAELAGFERIAYADIGMPVAALTGHAGHALTGTRHEKRVLAFAGRVHAYQGFSAREVARNVEIAADRGARTVFLTNAAGAINPSYKPGDLMVIADHLNLTGMNPLSGSGLTDPFINMTDAYSPRLRALAHRIDDNLREGVYAGLLGPTFETLAEARYLQTIGADVVGMSTVLETIAARARNLEVFGVSLITNAVADAATTHGDVMDAARAATPRLFRLLDGLLRSAI